MYSFKKSESHCFHIQESVGYGFHNKRFINCTAQIYIQAYFWQNPGKYELLENPTQKESTTLQAFMTLESRFQFPLKYY